MTKPNFQTPDMTQENIDKIASLFPNCITESKGTDGKIKKAVNFDMLRQMLSKDIAEGDEAYEFTWVGKKAAIVEANTPIRKTLRPCKEESADFDTTQNLYIEGDNLEALKLLQESYLGKVKMIYIDPPYNTGNDFIYRDDFKVGSEEWKVESGEIDEETGDRLFRNTDSNGRFHSDWCSMIYSRLLLARNLLTDDGVIFISIDDNEVENLRKICDEVFGEGNFFTKIIIQSNKRGQTYKQISKTHEYLLVYTKSEYAEFNELEKNEDNNDLNLVDEISNFNIRELRNRNPKFGRFNRPGLFYPIYVNPKLKDKDGFSPVSLERTAEFSVKILPLNSLDEESCWRWGKDKFAHNNKSNTLQSNVVAKAKQSGGYNIYEKYRKTTYKAKTIWDDVDVITEKGTVELGNLDLAYFPFPKPIELIKRSLILGSNSDDLILDFFSGSATTAHAVMQLNAEDGGNRKFIMVQLPEKTDENSEAFKAGYKNICEIGKERIRRAGKKIKEDSPLTTKNLDIGFRVLKVDNTNMKDVYYSATEYSQGNLELFENNIKEDRTADDLLFGCLLDWGLPLSLPYTSERLETFNVITYNNGDLIACFDANISEDAVKQIARRKPLRAVFRDSSFKDSSAKINVFEIFKMISPETDVKVI